MYGVLAVNLAVMRIGTHVGLHIDFVCPDLVCAAQLGDQLRVEAEAAKLLSTLGFDTSEIATMYEVQTYGTEEI